MKDKVIDTGYKLTLYTNLNMRCNMRCSYCYEKGKYATEPLSEEAFNKSYEFIKKTPLGSVILMGGEVLLEKEKILKVLDLIRTKNIENPYKQKIHVTIITNGTIYIEELKNYKDVINVIQITHDGPAHDINRKFIGGGSTSNLILENGAKYKKDGFFVVFHSVLAIRSHNEFLKAAPEFLDKIKASMGEVKWVMALQLVTSKEDFAKERWTLRKAHALYKNLYDLMKKYPFIKVAGTSTIDTTPCGVGSTLLSLNGETGELFGCENQPVIKNPEYSFLGSVGNINSHPVITEEPIKRSLEYNDLSSFRYQYLPKWLSQILFRIYPLAICPTEGYIYCNDSRIVPFFRLITAIYLSKFRRLKKELGYELY